MRQVYHDIFLKIAGFKFRIRFFMNELQLNQLNLYQEILTCNSNYALKNKEKVDFNIDVKRTHFFQLFNAKKQSKIIHHIPLFIEDASTKKFQTFYHLSYIQFYYLVIRALQILFLSNDGCILHASAVVKEGIAYLFLGPSGAGKSTASDLLKSKFRILADDTVIIRKINGKIKCFQSPIVGKIPSLLFDQKGYKIGGMFLLYKSKYNKLEKYIYDNKLLEIIMKQAWSTYDSFLTQEKFIKILFHSGLQIYHLFFRKDEKSFTNFFTIQKSLLRKNK